MRKLILIIPMLCLCLMSQAQRFAPYRQYVTLNAGVGINGYGYKFSDVVDYGKKDRNGGVMVRAGYHFMKRNCGFWAGLMLQSFNSSAVVKYYQDIPNAVDQDGEKYTHRTFFSNLEERNRQIVISLPVEFNYRVYLTDGMKLILGAGGLVNFPAKSRYSVNSGYIQTQMYYPEYDLWVDDLAPQHNLYTAAGFNGKYKLKVTPGLIFDASLMYPLEKNFELNVGLYGTVSASQIDAQTNVAYDPDCSKAGYYENPKYNGLFGSGVATKMSPFSFGISVGLFYTITYKEKAPSVAKP